MGKEQKEKPDGLKHSNSTEVRRAVQHISSRHRPSLTQGIDAAHATKHSFLFTERINHQNTLATICTLWENSDKGQTSWDRQSFKASTERKWVCSRKACQAGWYGFCRLYCYFIQIFPARSPGSGDWALLLQYILIRLSCTLKSGFLRITSYICGNWPVYDWGKQGERPRAGLLNISVGGERGMFWAQTPTNAARLCFVWCLTIKKRKR